jgi:hypothetical protein
MKMQRYKTWADWPNYFGLLERQTGLEPAMVGAGWAVGYVVIIVGIAFLI